jgi:hypothetical protein
VQEDSIRQPKRQHILRVDYRPTPNDSFSVKGQTWFTKSVGVNVAGASSRWGLVRQRYDFTADQAKFDYTRILGPNTVFEAAAGIFNSTENGPPEDETALAGIQRRSFPALANLPQFTGGSHNPLGLIPKVIWGNFQSSGNSAWVPDISPGRLGGRGTTRCRCSSRGGSPAGSSSREATPGQRASRRA